MSGESDQNSTVTGKEADSTVLLPSLERFNAFSDGVFAIAITLLVLDLPVPPAAMDVFPALLESWHEFLGYIISFAFIGGIWLTHSGMTKVMKRGDNVVYGINLVLLLFVAVLPFSTSLMVTHIDAPDVRGGVIVYGINVLLASLTLSLLMYYVAKEPGLIKDGVANEVLRRSSRRRVLVLGINVLALVSAVFEPRVAVGLYLVMTVMVLMLPFWHLHRHRRRK